ncbi:MAG: S9 family peptidase [Acidobacteriota bacterium]|nr:S9 family peptidase [Acidobacteriota bacterium]
MKILCCALLLLPFCLVQNYAFAQQSTEATTSKPLTPEAVLTLRFISDLQLSPDGSRLAFVVSEPPKADRRAQHIWMYDRASNNARQFTYSSKSETSPRWSSDGTRMAFLSTRDGDDPQIYVMPTAGGEAAAKTRGKRSIKSLAWSPDGKTIAYLAPEAKTEAQEKKEKDKDDARIVDKEDQHSRLWLMSVESGAVKAITPPNWEIKELAWLVNGEDVVIAGTDHPESDRNTDRIMSVHISNALMKQLVAPRGPFEDLHASTDGKTIGYVGARNDGPAPHDLMLLPSTGGAPRNVTAAALDRQIVKYCFLPDGSLLAIAADGFHTRFASFGVDGSMKDFTPPSPVKPSAATSPEENSASTIPRNPSAFAASDTGEIFFVAQSATQPQELFVKDQKNTRQLTHLNDLWKQYSVTAPEFYKYKSFDGLEIEAALLKPFGDAARSKFPLIALIHGGPTGAWEDTIDTWGQLLVARGYAVFYPNIRGSIGYGQKFIEMNRGDWGGADFKDVMAGVDDLVARGIADPEALGIGGWSYGGYMSEWAITQTIRFKAAVSGAGLSNLISEYGTEQQPSYDEWFYGVPYEPDKVAGFLNSSPFVHLKNARTPTLILQGEADIVDPVGQSLELYRGLKRYGVDTELVLYPREPHGFHEEKHLVDRLNRILAWYDKYLKPSSGPAANSK